MVGSKWTSVEQQTFLESHLGEYAKHAATKHYGKFWVSVNEAWLERWPLVQPEPIPEVATDPSDTNPPKQLGLQDRLDKSLALALDALFAVSQNLLLFATLLTD
jgi:hypothetical protein